MRTGTFLKILLSTTMLIACSALNLSQKARKLKRLQAEKDAVPVGNSNVENVPVSTLDDDNDDFDFDFDLDSEFDSIFDDDADHPLPSCEDEFGFGCEEVVGPPEVRHRDPVFERLLAQIWSDYQTKVNWGASLHGFVVDPLDIDALLPKPIDFSRRSNVYSADVRMRGMKLHGFSGIRLTDSIVTRSENLTDMKVTVRFSFDQLLVNGTYELKGFVGFWKLDSQGERHFSIRMVNATVGAELTMRLVDPLTDWSSLKCADDGGFGSLDDATVLITRINLPLEYADIDYAFDNLGSFANNVVNGVATYFLQTRRTLLSEAIRSAIKRKVNSLIC